jgi:hypothetical protein
MVKKPRFNQIENGMHFDEVKRVFGNDIWQPAWISNDTWMVNNEADTSQNWGYTITFDENMQVKSKGTFCCS